MKSIKRINRKSDILLGYFRLYIIYMIIILTAVITLQSAYISPNYMSSVKKTAESRFESVIYNVESELSSLENLSYYIAMDSDLATPTEMFSGTVIADSAQKLRLKLVEYPMLSDIIIYYGKDKTFLSSSGTISYKYIVDYDSSIQGWKNFYRDIESNKKNMYVAYRTPAPENRQCLAAVYKDVKLRNNGNSITIIYIVSDAYMQSLIKKTYDIGNGSFVIYSGNNSWMNITSNSVRQKKGDYEKKDGIYKDGTQLLMVKTIQQSTMKYIHRFAINSVIEQYIVFQTVVMLVIVLLGIISLLIAFKFSSISYKMVKKIYQPLIRTEADGEDNDCIMSAELKKLVSDIVNERYRMSGLIQTQTSYIKRQLLLGILNGTHQEGEQFENICKNISMDLSAEMYSVYVIDGAVQEKSSDDVIYDAVSRYLESNDLGYGVASANDNYIAVILRINTMENAFEMAESIIEHISDELKSKFGMEINAKSGGLCYKISDISSLYSCAMAKIRAEGINGNKDLPCEENDSADRKVYLMIMDIIENNYCDPNFGLHFISEQVDKSIYYVSRIIKLNLGYSFSRYISGLRIEKAKKLLKETNYTVAEITGMVGYLDVPSFNKKFKNTVGMTPGSYRKSISDGNA